MTPGEGRYDVIVAGARCAGAATAMVLARAGARVLVVDPARPATDTLSTHALMRGAVRQLARWGILARIRGAGTPPVHSTTFVYGPDRGASDILRENVVPIRPDEHVDALYAPRRSHLDGLLQRAAAEEGAALGFGHAVVGLARRNGRVVGAEIADVASRTVRTVPADIVVGADGLRSKVARLVVAPVELEGRHGAATLYSYRAAPAALGYRWIYRPGVSVGVIPTDGGEVCVFTAMPSERFRASRKTPLGTLHQQLLEEGAPDMAASLVPAGAPRGFAGVPGFLRQSAGPGWALVGDAGYFRDPITAHGITDALRDAEWLARAILEDRPGALDDYATERRALVEEFLFLSDEIASFEWTLNELEELHLQASRSMKRQASWTSALQVTSTAPSSDFAIGQRDACVSSARSTLSLGAPSGSRSV